VPLEEQQSQVRSYQSDMAAQQAAEPRKDPNAQHGQAQSFDVCTSKEAQHVVVQSMAIPAAATGPSVTVTVSGTLVAFCVPKN